MKKADLNFSFDNDMMRRRNIINAAIKDV